MQSLCKSCVILFATFTRLLPEDREIRRTLDECKATVVGAECSYRGVGMGQNQRLVVSALQGKSERAK